jgi:TetR/AcrR family transcriptional regulator, lmrAB and yxaGH operons repressor
MVTAELDTRNRLVRAMQRSLQTSGFHGTGLTALLAAAQAPKGVLYHHFPGGKRELAVAAVEAMAAGIHQGLDVALREGESPLAAFHAWLTRSAQRLSASGFTRGCPLATVTLETAHQDDALRAALHRAFDGIRARLVLAFKRQGHRAAEAQSRAALCVSAYEGALLVARANQSTAVLAQTLRALRPLLASPVRRRRGRRGAR